MERNELLIISLYFRENFQVIINQQRWRWLGFPVIDFSAVEELAFSAHTSTYFNWTQEMYCVPSMTEIRPSMVSLSNVTAVWTEASSMKKQSGSLEACLTPKKQILIPTYAVARWKYVAGFVPDKRFLAQYIHEIRDAVSLLDEVVAAAIWMKACSRRPSLHLNSASTQIWLLCVYFAATCCSRYWFVLRKLNFRVVDDRTRFLLFFPGVLLLFF